MIGVVGRHLDMLIQFEEYLKEVIWGGKKICLMKNISTHTDKKIGESWELSPIPGFLSKVKQPKALAGKTILELWDDYPQFFGRRMMDKGEGFPLLIKYIDAEANLSVQVHPNDELAQARHHCRGKSEMWYVVEADPGAKIYVGFDRELSKDDFFDLVQTNRIMEAVCQYEVKPGDVFFLPSGRIHAIGAGCLVAEIQQNSDITYRIYDYDRRDKDGQHRPLHLKEAEEALDFSVSHDYRTKYEDKFNAVQPLVINEYFSTYKIAIDKPFMRSYKVGDCCRIFMCVEGEVCIDEIHSEDASDIILSSEDDTLGRNREIASSVCLTLGHTLLVSAMTSNLLIKPLSSRATLLEISL